MRPAQARRMHWTTKLQMAAERILPPDHYRELGKRLTQPMLYGFIMRRAPLDPWVKTTFEVINARLAEEVAAAASVREQPQLPLAIAGGRSSDDERPIAPSGGRIELEIIETGLNNGYLEGYGSA